MKYISKVLFIALVVLFATGCEGEYRLEITDDGFKEEFTAISYDTTSWHLTDASGWSLYKDFYSNSKYPIAAFYGSDVDSEEGTRLPHVDYYEQEMVEYSDSLQLKYSYKFTKDNYIEAYSIKTVFADFTMNEKDKIVSMNSGPVFAGFINYPELDVMHIKIVTDKKVLEHNADEVNGNEYMWLIEKETVDEVGEMGRELIFSYSNAVERSTVPKIVLIIALLSIAIFGIVVIIFARYRMRIVNQ